MMVKKRTLDAILMNKKAKEAFWGVLIFAVTLSVLFLVGLVLAVFSAETSNTLAPGNYIIVKDDVTGLVNLSINNTDTAWFNISNVTIVLDGATFTIPPVENGSDTAGLLLTNFSGTRGEFTGGNILNQTSTYIWFNITATSPGRNTSGFNVSVSLLNATHQLAAESNITIHINDTFTVAANGSSNVANGENVSAMPFINYTLAGNETAIIVNVSISNRTGILQSNITQLDDGASLEWNWTGENLTGITAATTLPDEVYFFNITANNTLLDDAEVVLGLTFTLDSTAPTVALDQDNATSTKSKIVIDITATETFTGISGSCAVDNSLATISGTNLSQTMTDESGLSCGTSRKYTISCDDYAGNSGSLVYTGFTSDCTGGGGPAGGGPSGGDSSSGTAWTNTFVDDSDELSVLGSVTRQLQEKHRIKIKVNGETHFVGVIDGGLTESTATIEVSSAHDQSATLGIGDTERFDLDADAFYDITVTLNSIADNKADLTIEPVHEEVEVTEEEGVIDEGIGRVAEAVGVGSGIIWTIIIVIIIVIIVVIVYKRRNK